MSDEQVFEGSKPMPSEGSVGDVTWLEPGESLEEGLARLNADPSAFRPGAIKYLPPKTFTTQMVPHLVYQAILKHVEHVRFQLQGSYPHAALRIHPRDWQFLEDFLRQQGQLKEVDGPMGWVEIEGLTVLKDMSANVPHLDLSVG